MDFSGIDLRLSYLFEGGDTGQGCEFLRPEFAPTSEVGLGLGYSFNPSELGLTSVNDTVAKQIVESSTLL